MDTAGQERFRMIATAYYCGVMGIFIVYDVTNERTFTNVRQWYKTVTEQSNDDAQIMLVWNKSNMENRVVIYEQGDELAKRVTSTIYRIKCKG